MWKCKYIETSAKNNVNITELFEVSQNKKTSLNFYFKFSVFNQIFLFPLAWEPSFTWKLMSLYTSQHTQLQILKPSCKEIYAVLPVPQSKWV